MQDTELELGSPLQILSLCPESQVIKAGLLGLESTFCHPALGQQESGSTSLI